MGAAYEAGAANTTDASNWSATEAVDPGGATPGRSATVWRRNGHQSGFGAWKEYPARLTQPELEALGDKIQTQLDNTRGGRQAADEEDTEEEVEFVHTIRAPPSEARAEGNDNEGGPQKGKTGKQGPREDGLL